MQSFSIPLHAKKWKHFRLPSSALGLYSWTPMAALPQTPITGLLYYTRHVPWPSHFSLHSDAYEKDGLIWSGLEHGRRIAIFFFICSQLCRVCLRQQKLFSPPWHHSAMSSSFLRHLLCLALSTTIVKQHDPNCVRFIFNMSKPSQSNFLNHQADWCQSQ